MILEKLVERKDILAFIAGRIASLKEDQKRAVKLKDPARREVSFRQIQGRIKELQYVKKILQNHEEKLASKQYWKEAAKRREWMQEKR